jgi:hypothetical protein
VGSVDVDRRAKRTKKPRECGWTSSLADVLMVGPVVDDVVERETRRGRRHLRHVRDCPVATCSCKEHALHAVRPARVDGAPGHFPL